MRACGSGNEILHLEIAVVAHVREASPGNVSRRIQIDATAEIRKAYVAIFIPDNRNITVRRDRQDAVSRIDICGAFRSCQIPEKKVIEQKAEDHDRDDESDNQK